MIRVSDIMDKEIINVKNGKKMGFITDIDIDVNEGKVVSFSTTGESSGGFFSRGMDIFEWYTKNRMWYYNSKYRIRKKTRHWWDKILN